MKKVEMEGNYFFGYCSLCKTVFIVTNRSEIFCCGELVLIHKPVRHIQMYFGEEII